MLTPQEVSERVFPKASFGGYNMAQVDEFLDLLTEDYSTLYSENAVLKSKMKVLVDKVEEYRSTENAMRKALMTAQRMADDTVKEAEQRRDEIIRQAQQQRDELLAHAEENARAQAQELGRQVEAEEFRLAQAKKATTDYVRQLRRLHDDAVAYLDGLDQLAPPQAQPEEPAPAAPADPVDETVSDIDESVQRLLARAMDDVAAEKARGEAPDGGDDQEDTIPLPDVTAAVVNGNYALDFGLKTEEAIYKDSVLDEEQYWNLIAARTADLKDPTKVDVYKKVVAAFQSDATAKVFHDDFGGYFIKVGWDQDLLASK